MAEEEYEGYPQPWWQRWQIVASLAALSLALGIWSWVLHDRSTEQTKRIAVLEKRIATGPLIAPGNVRSIKVMPQRNGPGGKPQLTLNMPQPPNLIELRINVSFARFNTFRLLIDRKDQGRAGVIRNLLRDSNGELHVAINTSVLYPGTYEVAIEGMVNRGNPIPVGWLTIKVTE